MQPYDKRVAKSTLHDWQKGIRPMCVRAPVVMFLKLQQLRVEFHDLCGIRLTCQHSGM